MSLAQELEILGADSNRDAEHLITLNLRGTLITVNSRCADSFPGSRLWRALRRQEPQPMRDEQGRSFFNRNPTLFHEVLDVAVNDGEVLFSPHDEVQRRRLALELAYWGLHRPKRERESTERVNRNYGPLEVILPK